MSDVSPSVIMHQVRQILSELLQYQSMARHWRLRPEQLERLQLCRLQALVRHATNHVPFYRDLYRSHGIEARDIRCLGDIARLPIVTKEQLRDAGDATVADNADPNRVIEIHTSGSTGTPLRVVRSPGENQTQRVLQFHNLRTIGFNWRDRLAFVGPHVSRQRRAYERLGLFRTKLMTGIAPVAEIIDRLEAFQPTILWIYPHVLHLLLNALDGRLSRIVRPHTFLVSGAMLEQEVWERVHADLDCRMLQLYGCIEVGRLATACTASDGLHVNAGQVIMEILDGDRPVSPGTRGTTVVTGLNGYTMPFIRYQLGDYCTILDAAPPCECGTHFPLISAPYGRADDVFRFPGGRVLASLPFLYALRRQDGIDQFRLVQKEPTLMELEIASRQPWPEIKIASLRADLAGVVPDDIEFNIRFVDFIPSDGPKLRAFVCELPDD